MRRPEYSRFLRAWVALGLLRALTCAAPAAAQLSPGPLSRAHANLEGVENCTRCHKVAKKVTADKCLACHTALAQRITDRQGLHAAAGYESCEECHVEHQGRDYELMWWGKEGRNGFAHAKTGWNLDGRHGGLPCERCHRASLVGNPDALKAGGTNPERTYLGLPTSCGACHPDPHAGQCGTDCARCHGNETWKTAERFDHSRARFALAGKHKEVACSKCHPTLPARKDGGGATSAQDSLSTDGRRQWTGLQFASCVSCHRDPHEGKLGGQCSGCHVVDAWQRVAQGRFDHERTSYPLRGRHATVACDSCHRGNRAGGGLRFAACKDCHADQHGGQFSQTLGGGDCAQCHTVEGFVPSTCDTERHARSAYPLAGAHLAVPCNGCHARPKLGAPVSDIPFRFASTRCRACHQDPHRGEADPWIEKGGCESCHSPEAWTVSNFDHSATRFPLAGKHAQARCAGCHRAGDAKAGTDPIKLRNLNAACESCHRDPHAGQFLVAGEGTRCERCHAPTGWRPALFDHNRDTTFKLDGAHQRARCDQCHRREGEGDTAFVRYRIADRSCAGCHDKGAPAR
jgi:hypothetical protein